MTEKTFQSKDGKSTVHYYVWEPEGTPVAVLQLVHGMAEHIMRYEAFAQYLNSFGILVVGNDHIGHGKSSDKEDWGYFGAEGGWKNMVKDVEQLRQIIAVEYMDVPYFIMGHSMGSFVTRAWLSIFGSGVDGVIIMGTAGSNPVLGAGKALVSVLRKTKGDRHLSKLVNNMAFGSYNKRIKPKRTEFDWLTRDEAIVDKYIEDPACGFPFTLAGFADLFGIIGFVNEDRWYSRVPKDIPLLLVSGAEDPVGAYGQGPAEVAGKLEEAGCGDVSLLLYEDMRHEVLNEFGKEIVMEDIKRFILDEEAPETDGELHDENCTCEECTGESKEEECCCEAESESCCCEAEEKECCCEAESESCCCETEEKECCSEECAVPEAAAESIVEEILEDAEKIAGGESCSCAE